MTLGQKLKRLRVERGITTRKISELFNVGKSTISNYENDVRRPDHEMLVRLANFYNVSVDYLLGTVENKSTYSLKDIPPELKEVGFEYIALAKEIEEEGLSPEAIRELIEFAKKMKK